jgi:hypothetical protein
MVPGSRLNKDNAETGIKGKNVPGSKVNTSHPESRFRDEGSRYQLWLTKN